MLALALTAIHFAETREMRGYRVTGVTCVGKEHHESELLSD